MADKNSFKIQLKKDQGPVMIAHGHITGEFLPGTAYDCTPEEWEQIFMPMGMFETAPAKKEGK